jgi:hypothetical protein
MSESKQASRMHSSDLKWRPPTITWFKLLQRGAEALARLAYIYDKNSLTYKHLHQKRRQLKTSFLN